MIRSWLKSLVEVIFPAQCAVCGEALVAGEKTICTSCRWDMPLTDYWSAHENFMVERLAARVPFVEASALMFFRRHSHYRTLIHRMKYGGRRDVARMLGEIYGTYLHRSELYRGVQLIVPVPLHYTKFIKRGYNQSEEFARGIASSLGVEVCTRALVRTRRTHTQAQLHDSLSRAENVEGAFRVVRPELLVGRGVLLVDDVVTTGATLQAAASAIVMMESPVRLYLGAIAIVR
ncbi:MAG: phosphoribosyltransferase family protein [Mucinivorans sp.]